MSGLVIFAVGPESNGTRLLQRILDSGTQHGKAVYHWPLPNNGVWWDWRDHRVPMAVILRDPVIAAQSAVRAGHVHDLVWALEEQARARRELAGLIPERTFSITYEELVAEPDSTVRMLDRWLRRLDYAGEPLTHEPIIDGNARYKSATLSV